MYEACGLSWVEPHVALVDSRLSIRVYVAKELDHHRVRRNIVSTPLPVAPGADGRRDDGGLALVVGGRSRLADA